MRYSQRIKELQHKTAESGLDSVILSYSRDVLYYTGTAQPAFFVVFPDEFFLFVRSGLDFVLKEAFIPKKNIFEERDLNRIYRRLFYGFKGKKKIGTELDVLTAAQFLHFQKAFPGYEFTDISDLILDQRKEKDESELKNIREACEASDKGHRAVLNSLREGVTELELAASIENAHRLAGHEGTFFIRKPDFFMSRGPLSSGPNLFRVSGVVYSITGVGLSPSVPVGPSRRTISNGDLVVVDIPTHIKGYHADQTRTYLLGDGNRQIHAMYDRLKEISDYLLETIKPGMKASDVYKKAIKKSEDLKVADSFLSFGNGQKCKMIGHGVGLEINEPPILSEYDHSTIRDNFVLALDLHMMDLNVGAMKLEDMVLVSRNGNEILNISPRDLHIL